MAKSELPSDPTPGGPSGPADRMDRSRLQQIQQSELTEGRVNEDFLYWLKTKGLNYAAVLLLVLVAVMAFNLFKERRASERDTAWIELAGASVPASLEDIAQRHTRIDSIAPWALIDAADRYFAAALRGVRLFDREPDAEDYRLDPDQRRAWMDEADRLYREVGERARTSRDFQRRGFLVASLFGRAAIAESRGDVDAARGFLGEIAEVTRDTHPPIAALAEQRIEGLVDIAVASDLPLQASLPARDDGIDLTAPIVTDDLLRDLLTPTAPPTDRTTGVPSDDGE